jgi:uncharacterized protein (DUF885 family)
LIVLLIAASALLRAAPSPAAPAPAFHYDARAEGWLRPDGGFDMTAALMRYVADRATLDRYYDVRLSNERMDALDQFDHSWLHLLEQAPFDALDVDGRVDYLLLRNALEQDLHRRAATMKRQAEMSGLLPFEGSILGLDDNLRRFVFIDGAEAASKVTQIADQIAKLTAEVNAGRLKAPATTAMRASRTTESLRQTLKRWFDFYNGYNPEFSWWVDEPWKRADAALAAYAALLREKIAGIAASDKDTIVGDPVGREVLQDALAAEFIPYSPEELIAIARREFAWCRAEMIAAARDMGYGDDWRKALEHVKNDYVKPGGQPALIRDLAHEAVGFVRQHDLITVPDAAVSTWRMEMMTPERQRINPFFTGGDTMSVSFPTESMTEEQKLMSMRGNNIHFARATVFHELIPGHYLQEYMSERYRPWRRPFDTPFWIEGWAFYWETLLWDLDFPRSPEDRMGMLFWRIHRAARVIFSLSFHLGEMTAPQAVEFLVNEVGHERENAAAEVRRSFESSDYGALYQCAYEIGALQFRALHAEFVDSGRMTDRQFHDAVLQLNSMPVEMIRASLLKRKLPKDFAPQWRFYDEAPAGRHAAGRAGQ